ncbi:xyloside xylosyltransferase 1-like [Ischnura elegans]|uniref:xyloside xylosyltransferase 1-like n=1 Tax=Ischnura elegans TaxID=197161 RepID=UPI001ED89602|nr:xyloside xylosyltransferase 1-like [Ischnura elegans]
MIAMQVPPAIRSDCGKRKKLKAKRQKKLAASLLIFVVSVLGVSCGLTRLAVDAEASALIAAVLDAQASSSDGSDNQGTSHVPAGQLGPWVTSDVSRDLMQVSSLSVDANAAVDAVNRAMLTDPDGLGVVHVVMIVTLPSEGGDVSFPSSARFTNMFERCMESLLCQARRIPVHFILLTDRGSEVFFRKIVVKIAVSKSRVPVFVDAVALADITANVTSSLERLRSHLPSTPRTKYADPLFHVGPLLPFVPLPGKPNRVLVLDVDLRFRADISQLRDVFEQFGTRQAIAMAPELSPLYSKSFKAHREKFPESKLGLPRPGYQGFNYGVALMDLGRLRSSEYYRDLVIPSSDQETTQRKDNALANLIEKYSFQPSGVGDQDFFTLLAAERPDLFYILDCSWNVQLDLNLKSPENSEEFERYHYCCPHNDVQVYHGNAGYPIPEN